MALEPITREEQIIAGKDLKPITRMEMFLKEYGGGGGKSQAFVVNFNTQDMQTWTCDKTPAEIAKVFEDGKDIVGLIAGSIKIDFLGVMPNGSVTFGRVLPDGDVLLSYYFLVSDTTVKCTMASVQMNGI